MMEEFIFENTKINYKIMKIDCVCMCCVRRIEKRIIVVVCTRSERETIFNYFRFILTSGYVDRARTNNIAKFGIVRTRQQCGLDTISRPRSE